jgi:Domain of unknown function (DUF4190)/GYF domain 2
MHGSNGRVSPQPPPIHMYHISHQGSQQGPHSIEEINELISRGELSTADLAWQEGMSDWVPLTSVPGVIAPPPLPAASPPPVQPSRGPQPYAPPRSAITQPRHTGPPSNSGMAIASMVLGILSIVLFFTHIFALIMGLLAVIFGHVSRGHIRRAQGRLAGGGMALAGLITGYIGLLIVIIVITLAALFFTTVINEAQKDPDFRRTLEQMQQKAEERSRQNQ